MNHLKSMFAPDRLPFTAVYMTSMASTLYFTFSHGGLSGYVLTLSSTAVQIAALVWYLVSFMPGGEAGMKVVRGAVGKVCGPVCGGCAVAGRKCCEAVIRSATG